MINRWLAFAACALAGGGLGALAASREGVFPGMIFGLFVWLAFDSVHMLRLLKWLRVEQNRDEPVRAVSRLPRLRGLTGEIADRARRLLAMRDNQYSESQARLEEFLSAIQASPSGVVLMDDKGRIEWCNLMATQHFGFDASRDLQQQITNLVREPGFVSYMTAGDFSHDTVIAGHKSSPGRPVKISVHVHAYGKNRRLLLSRDITSVELAEAMRRDFVANVSHEIRTPLTVLSGFIETLQTLPLDDSERVHYLGLMAQQSARMQTLVSDLLTLSRLEGSPLPPVHDWVNTQALMAQCEQEVRALSALVSPRGHHLEFEVNAVCEIAGSQAELYSAMSNLATNAVRYTPEGGSITVGWQWLEDGRGRFMVRDNGPGIAPEHLPRLTERFYRVDRSRSRETGGTGLGLAIVKHVAQRHAAELKIDSQQGQGSCFSMTFPAERVRLVKRLQSP